MLGSPSPRNLGIFEPATGPLVVFEGYLFDQEELINELAASPRATEPELIAIAYRRFGVSIFERIRGGFILIIWDTVERQLLVGRDAMGLHACYYCCSRESFIVSSSIDAILAQREVPDSFNRAVIGEFLEGPLSAHQRSETFYSAIQRLPSAHKALISHRSFEVSRYWDPVPPGFEWAGDDSLNEFEPALRRAVSRCLSVGADSIALSGGFDSVSLAVLAAAQLAPEKSLQAISMRFDDPKCDEGDTQSAVAKALCMPQIIRTLEESLDGRSYVEECEKLSSSSPCPVLSVWQSFYTGLFSAVPDNCRRLMLGTGGDDLLNVDLSYGADCLATMKLNQLWRFVRVTQRASDFPATHVARIMLWDYGIKLESRALVSRLLERFSPKIKNWCRSKTFKPALLDEEIVTLLQKRRDTAPQTDYASGERRYVQAIRQLTQSPLFLLEHDQAHSWARHTGFTLLYPYFDQDFTAMLLRTPPEYLIAGGRAKAPLRSLVSRRLPSVTLPSKKIDFSHMVNKVLRTQGQAQWKAMDGPSLLSHLGIVKPDMVNSFMASYFGGQNNLSNKAWQILSTELWLRARSHIQGVTPPDRIETANNSK